MKDRVKCTRPVDRQGPLVQVLEANGFEVSLSTIRATLFSEETLIQELTGFSAAVAGTEGYTRRMLQALPDLRVIARLGVGMDNIDLAACDEFGVAVTTTPGINQHAVAEHVIALLMAVARGFPLEDQRVRTGKWIEVPPQRVMGSTLGIVGLGRTGQALTSRAAGLGMKVIGFEPFPDPEFIERWGIELCSLDELLSRSDFVSLHSPSTAETRHLMNADRFARMKPGSVLINAARGALVDEAALIDALRSGHLRGAGLDVFEKEPLPLESPLLTFPNVLLSPHIAGLDAQGRHETFVMAANSIVSLRNGVWPLLPNVQNLRQVANWTWKR